MAKEIRITFKDDELELFEYIKNSPSPSMFIKMVMLNKMQLDKRVEEQTTQLIQQYQMALMNINNNPLQQPAMQMQMQPAMQVQQPMQQVVQQQEQPKQQPMIDLSDLGLDI